MPVVQLTALAVPVAHEKKHRQCHPAGWMIGTVREIAQIAGFPEARVPPAGIEISQFEVFIRGVKTALALDLSCNLCDNKIGLFGENYSPLFLFQSTKP